MVKQKCIKHCSFKCYFARFKRQSFFNKSGALPSTDAAGNLITYREFDVNNYVPGQNRGVERFVVGSDGSIYYTDSHYGENKSLNGFPDYIKID